jgi:nicotinate-nucleotide pyrophosphorylase (carboxylating)
VLDPILSRALEEDIGAGDLTTRLTVPPGAHATARIVAKEGLVLAGTFVVDRVFSLLDDRVRARWLFADGDDVPSGATVAELEGPARSLLTGERVALNFLQRLSGIASQARALVAAAAGTQARVVDTRKTTPGLRALEKWAVCAGGASNHRAGLYDGILIKENHIAAAGGLARAIRAAKAGAPHTLQVEVEIERFDQIDAAIAAGAETILLDNFREDEWPRAVALVAGRAKVEISGNMNARRVALAARAGADLVSVGALTHSVRAADLSMRIDPPRKRSRS